MNKKAKRIIALILSVGIIGTSLVGCGNNEESNGGEGLKNTELKLQGEAVSSDKVVTTLVDVQPPPAFNGNPYDTAGVNWSIQPLMFDYLAEFSAFPETTFKESLLESYTLENKVLTMKLKSGLKWSDGSPLTATDVMTNYYVNVGKSAVWTYAEKIEQIDELTVQITYASESPLLLNIAFALPIMSPTSVYGKWADQYKVVAETQREYKEATNTYEYTVEGQETLTNINNDLLTFKPDPKEVICSGPYVIGNVTTAEILFEQNPEYREDIYIEQVRGLRPGSSEAFATSVLEQQYSLENGGLSIDMAAQVDKKYEETMRKVFIPELSQIGFAFNASKYPVSIPEVRKAISLATDRETLISIAEPGSFLSDTRNTGLIPSLIDNYTTDGFVDTLTDYNYNLEEATKVLESIGWSKNKDGIWTNEKGEVVTIEIATINSWPSLMLTSEAMSAMLKEFGFDVDFKPMEGGTIWSYLSSEDAMIGSTFLGGAGTYAHPWEAFNNILTSTRIGLPQLEKGEDRILTAPSTGKEYNITQMLRQLFQATEKEDIEKLTEEFMTLLNDLSLFMPVIEKSAPLRVYDTTLSLPEGESGQLQSSFYYFGSMNQMLAKMIKANELYFTE
ncbi:glutathione ABC transporter substrate-binding protein GsiB [uncultured Clostridium sp.]|uniref:ABC transporter substrate-binding protein n=1 Tax=uncultured Clostridium sp. TaxID=59620 RepID=UPI000820B7CF|nr:ABC transporter substrate-binding protein [uncultured Clostridium sp.]SCI84608.1 glutathione ABC transporter substrate-binding protein GsiB [uncultured Clostridium sp.]